MKSTDLKNKYLYKIKELLLEFKGFLNSKFSLKVLHRIKILHSIIFKNQNLLKF